jgi:hypothetical protein
MSPATSALERAARAAWRVQVTHHHADGCSNGSDWHPLLVEARRHPSADHYVVGDVWWPGSRPVAWLQDWHAHPETAALLVVSNGARLTATGVTSVHVIACVSRDGRSIVLASPDDEPPRIGGRLCGPLYKAMLQALSCNAS